MRILVIGDVVGGNGCRHLRDKLPSFRREKNIDVVICNGENSSDGNGITPSSARYLFDSGVDVITLEITHTDALKFTIILTKPKFA